MNEEKIRPVHPLIAKNITVIQGWKQWKERWDSVTTKEEMIGLLDSGFSTSVGTNEEQVDRVRFYFDIADSYDYEFNLADPKFRYDSYEAQRIKSRCAVTRKAFLILCRDFFGSDKEIKRPIWTHYIQEPVIQKILEFFNSSLIVSFYNLPSNYSLDEENKQSAYKFLQDFLALIWGDEGCLQDTVSWETKRRIHEILVKFRPQTIPLLNRINKLGLLLNSNINVDHASMKELKKLTLGEFGEKKYKTAEEALVGKPRLDAPRVYILLKIKKQEKERQEKIAEAKRKKLEAEQRFMLVKQKNT